MGKVRASKRVLAENLSALMKDRDWKQQAVADKTNGAMDQSTVGRIMRASVSTTTDRIDALAAAFGLEPWHLFVPNLDPNSPPRLKEPSSGGGITPEVLSLAKKISALGEERRELLLKIFAKKSADDTADFVIDK